MSAGAFLIGRGPDGKDLPVTVNSEGSLKVDIGSATLSVTADGVEIKNDSGNPIPTSVPARAPTTTSVASSATSVPVLAANVNRKGLSISNISSSKLYLSFNDTASVANCFIEMQPGEFRLFDQQLIFGNAIYGIWDAVNGAAQVTEYV
jgi:hypothetical protein